MSDKQTFRLVHKIARDRALAAVHLAPEGSIVTVGPPTRNLEQNARLHAVLSDIADQVVWHGQRLSLDVWKRLCTAAWLREIGESPEMVPALDGKGFDVLFEKTSRLSVRQMSSLIEWVQMFGAQNGVTFHEPAQEMRER